MAARDCRSVIFLEQLFNIFGIGNIPFLIKGRAKLPSKSIIISVILRIQASSHRLINLCFSHRTVMCSLNTMTDQRSHIFIGIQKIQEFNCLLGMSGAGRYSQKASQTTSRFQKRRHQGNKGYFVSILSHCGLCCTRCVRNRIGEQCSVGKIIVSVRCILIIV